MNKCLLGGLAITLLWSGVGPSAASSMAPAENQSLAINSVERTTVVTWVTPRKTKTSARSLIVKANVRSGNQLQRRVVKLKRQTAKRTWKTVQRKRTRSNGVIRFRIKQRADVTKYRLRVPRTSRFDSETSTSIKVRGAIPAGRETALSPELASSPSYGSVSPAPTASLPSPTTTTPGDPNPPPPTQQPTPGDAGAICDSDAQHAVLGQLGSDQLDEVSGLVASGRSSERFWVHNDSGDSATLYAISSSGALEQVVNLSGTSARDWEDISVGPGPETGEPYLYAGDIGDNHKVRASVKVHRLVEPAVGSGSSSTPDFDTIELFYPDGPHNAETLLVDPWDGSLLIVTKAAGGTAQLFSTENFGPGNHSRQLVHRGSVNISETATAGDISRDGFSLLIRGYGGLYGWSRSVNEPLWSALSAQSGCRVNSVGEPQGEAVGFLADGSGYLTISEFTNQPLNRFLFP